MAEVKAESHGCTLQFGEYATGLVAEATDTLGQITSIDGPEWSMDVVNITTNDSTGLMEYVAAGIADGGEVTVGLILNPTGTDITEIVAELEAGGKNTVKITTTIDTDYVLFPAVFTGLKIIPGPQDGTADAVKAELHMKVSDSIGIVA